MSNVNFTTTAYDFGLIGQICARYEGLALKHGFTPYDDRTSREMDLTATHLNGNPLDLEKFLAAPDFDFIHDIDGIARHLDRETGKLGDCFSPRCSRPEARA